MESNSLISTLNTKMMEIVFNSAIKDKKMAVVTGDAGSGKTTYALAFAAASAIPSGSKAPASEHAGVTTPRAIYNEIVKGQRTRDLLKSLCAALKIDPKRSNYATFEAICESLSAERRVIIIDQAEFLRADTIEILRGIWDRTKTTIILVGIKDLLKVLYKHEHLYSRIKWAWEMQLLRDIDIAALLTKEEAGLVGVVAKLAHRNFRSTSYLIDNARAIAGGKVLDEQILRDAKQLLLM